MSDAEYQWILFAPSNFCDSPLRQLDRWTELLGLALRLCWVRMEGIPLHAWSENIFQRLGECVGQVVEIDEDALFRRRVDVLRVGASRFACRGAATDCYGHGWGKVYGGRFCQRCGR